MLQSSIPLCPCGSNKNFQRCCSPYLNSEVYPKTPEKLMRSRYVAYAMGGYGDYLLETWFPATRQGLTAISLSEKNIEWVELIILSKSQSGDNASVEFNAIFVNENGQRQVHHEHSVFKRLSGKWLYVGGEVDNG